MYGAEWTERDETVTDADLEYYGWRSEAGWYPVFGVCGDCDTRWESNKVRQVNCETTATSLLNPLRKIARDGVIFSKG